MQNRYWYRESYAHRPEDIRVWGGDKGWPCCKRLLITSSSIATTQSMDASNISSSLYSTHRTADYSDGVDLARVVPVSLMSVMNVVALVGNSLIMFVISRIPQESMKPATKVYCMGHALTDLFNEVIAIVGPLSEWIGDWVGWTYGRETFCRVVGFLATAFPGITILYIMLINMDRYMLITKPMVYARVATKRRALVACVTLTSFNVFVQFLFVYFSETSFEIIRYHPGIGMCLIDFTEPSFLPFSLAVFTFAWFNMLLLVIQYCRIICISLKHKQKLNLRLRRFIPTTASSVPPPSHIENSEDTNKRSTFTSFRAHPFFHQKFDVIDLDCPSQRSKLKIVVDTVDGPPSKDLLEEASGSCPSSNPSIDKRSQIGENFSTISHESERMSSKTRTGTVGLVPVCPSSHVVDSPSTDVAPVTVACRQSTRASRHNRVNRNQDIPAGFSELKENLRIIRTPVIITSLFFVTFLPVSFVDTYLAATGTSMSPYLNGFFCSLVAMSGVINIFVYYTTIKPFRTTLKTFIKCRWGPMIMYKAVLIISHLFCVCLELD